MKKIIGVILLIATVATVYIFNRYEEEIEVFKEDYIVHYEIKNFLDFYYGQDIIRVFKTLGLDVEDPVIKDFIERHKDVKLVDGMYDFKKKKYSLKEIVEKLEKGDHRELRLVIWEGESYKQIEKKLVAKNLFKKGELNRYLSQKDFPYPTPNNSYEGYFLPGTHTFEKGTTGEEVVDGVLNKFLENYPPEKHSDKEKFYEKLVMASVIEREVIHNEEDGLVSSVFHNRIAKKMRLQSDATVNYLFDYSIRRVLYRHLWVRSPYNTYRVAGLPPTPICNPAKSAINAALKPPKTNYYYFVTDGNGKWKHHFTETYEEHIKFQRSLRRKKKKK